MLVTAAISHCGTHLVYVTTARLRLLRMSLVEGEASLERLSVPDPPEDIHHVCLPADRLVLISLAGLSVFSLSKDGAELERTVSLSQLGLVGAVSRVAHTDTVMVLVDSQDTMVTFSLSSYSLGKGPLHSIL